MKLPKYTNVPLMYDWQDGSGVDETKASYWARENGGYGVWPGCGRVGACKPCGKIKETSPGKWICAQYEKYGCPSIETQKAHVSHDWGLDRCRVCGLRRGWTGDSGQWYETRRKALLAGEITFYRAIGEKRGNGR
jgi:hypothetical protein